MELNKYKVLIVEDDKVSSEIKVQTLRDVGFMVRSIDRGDIAIPVIRDWKPHAVILDLELPYKSGSEIIFEMLNDRELKKVLVIAHTVHMDGKDDLGFSFYAQFKAAKEQEPIMVDKLNKRNLVNNDIRFVLASELGKKYGMIPAGLARWVHENRQEIKLAA